jgi:hypothetical protein
MRYDVQIIHAFDHLSGPAMVSHFKQTHQNCSIREWDQENLWDLMVTTNLLRIFLNVGFTELAPYGTLQVYNVTVRYSTRVPPPLYLCVTLPNSTCDREDAAGVGYDVAWAHTRLNGQSCSA